MLRRFTTAAAAGCAGALVLGLGTPASAQEDTAEQLELTAEQKADLDSRATDALRDSKPGGERIAPDKIAWDDGDVVLTLAVDGETRDAAPRARDGHVYIYDGAGFAGDSLSFYKCGSYPLRDYDWTNKTSSWINNQYGDEIATLYRWAHGAWGHIDGSGAYYEAHLMYNQTNTADLVSVCTTS